MSRLTAITLSGVRRHWRSGAAAAVMLFWLAGTATAAVYIKFDGVPGEASATRFADWTEVVGVSQRVVREGDTTAVPVLGLEIQKRIDKASPLLMKKCGEGAIIPRVIVVYEESGAAKFRLVLEDVRIGSIAQQGGGDAGQVMESVGLEFRRATWSSIDVGTGGDVKGGTSTTFDAATATGSEKSRPAFRAEVDAGVDPGVIRLRCPVEKGHRYRVAITDGLKGPWQTVLEFTAADDGVAEQTVRNLPATAFLRVEEIE